MTEQISGYFKNRIPGQWGHPGPFRDKGTKSGSVPDVPGRLATMVDAPLNGVNTYSHRPELHLMSSCSVIISSVYVHVYKCII